MEDYIKNKYNAKTIKLMDDFYEKHFKNIDYEYYEELARIKIEKEDQKYREYKMICLGRTEHGKTFKNKKRDIEKNIIV